MFNGLVDVDAVDGTTFIAGTGTETFSIAGGRMYIASHIHQEPET